MKKYIKPIFEFIEIRSEEICANCSKAGACSREMILKYNMQSLS